MKHIHLKEINSTQNYIIQALSNGEDIDIVSCNKQTKGIGRGSNSWDNLSNSLAFSFKTRANEALTLSPLEVCVILLSFLNSSKLKLKWPNDILDSNGKKCGGILTKLVGDDLIIGIGLNYGINNHQDFGYVFDTKISEEDYKNIPEKFYNYFLNNRLNSKNIIKQWNQNCLHLNRKVTITDDTSQTGIFKGIGEYGEAILDINGKETKIFTGSLIIH